MNQAFSLFLVAVVAASAGYVVGHVGASSDDRSVSAPDYCALHDRAIVKSILNINRMEYNDPIHTDPELVADLYDWCQDQLKEAGGQ